MKILARSIMFISSYFPLYILLLVLQYEKYKNILFGKCNEFRPAVFLAILAMLILVSIYSLWLIYKAQEVNFAEIKNTERASDHVVSYVFTYITPMLSFNLDDGTSILANIILFLLIWFLYIKLRLIYLNPLWALFGYVTYKNNDSYILTDLTYEELKLMEGKKGKGVFLVNGVFLAKRKWNL